MNIIKYVDQWVLKGTLLYLCSHIYLHSLSKLNIHKPKGSDKMSLKVLRQLAVVIVCLLHAPLTGHGNQRSFPVTEKGSTMPTFEKSQKDYLESYRLWIKSTWKLCPGTWRIRLVGNRDQGITKNKSCQTNLFVFYDKILGCPLKGREVDVVHVDFNRVLDVILCRILTAKLVRYGLDKWIQRWENNCLVLLILWCGNTWLLVVFLRGPYWG